VKAVAIEVHYQRCTANDSKFADDITGGPAPAYCWDLGPFYYYTSTFDWLITHVSQIYYRMGGGSFSERLAVLLVLAPPVHVP
jgi:hypothetical protein